MTKSTKFPDAEAIESVKRYLKSSGKREMPLEEHAAGILTTFFTDYRTRTGIDLADVSEKLASGKYKLVEKDPEPASP